jgi:SAM-dependent methyltransferase
MPLAGDFDYDLAGHHYTAYRRSDPDIGVRIREVLGDVRTVLNVGAGTGSYEPTDCQVVAVEPSEFMRAQRPDGAAPVIAAVAGDLPFADRSFDASMATITVHQWPDPIQGLCELRRVTRGPVVVLTFDGDALDRFWLADYVPRLIAAEHRRYPAISDICAHIGQRAEVQVVPISNTCTDGFTEAFYGRPECFLDPAVRRAQSAWAFVPRPVELDGVEALAADLESGAWDSKYGELRDQPTFEGSLRLLVGYPDGPGG